MSAALKCTECGEWLCGQCTPDPKLRVCACLCECDTPGDALGSHETMTEEQVTLWLAHRGTMPEGSVVYLVQLLPELDPNRLKVGRTNDLPDRLKNFRTICPSARLLSVASGEKLLETHLIDGFTRTFRRIHGEVFHADVAAAVKYFNDLVRGGVR